VELDVAGRGAPRGFGPQNGLDSSPDPTRNLENDLIVDPTRQSASAAAPPRRGLAVLIALFGVAWLPCQAQAQFVVGGIGFFTTWDYTEPVLEAVVGTPPLGPFRATVITSWSTTRTLLEPVIIPQVGGEVARFPWVVGLDLGAVWTHWTEDTLEPNISMRIFYLTDGPWFAVLIGSTPLEEWRGSLVLKFNRALWWRS
jgi:hypothetical protein